MFVQRQTIKSNVSITGIGLHSGIYTTVELHPAPAGSGITFVRADLQGLRIPALQASTTALEYATTVGKDKLCRACFDGVYPIELPLSERLGKNILEDPVRTDVDGLERLTVGAGAADALTRP